MRRGVQEIVLRTHHSRRCDRTHLLGRYRGQGYRSQGQVRLWLFCEPREEWRAEHRGEITFMMSQDAARDFHLCSRCLRRQVGRSRLQKEEWLFRDRIIEFLDMVEIVATDSDDLERV